VERVDPDPVMVYYNTRVRAMKSVLLSREEFEELLDENDIGAIVEYLLNAPYEADLAESLTRYEGADAVEDAVSRNLVRTFNKLLNFAQGEFKSLAALFLERWDLAAVKALLRTKHHNLSPQQALEDIPPGPTLTMALIRDLVERDSMESVVAGLVAWNRDLGQPLAQNLGEYAETNNLAVLEDALDRRYFVENVRRLSTRGDEDSKFLARFLQMEIDRINLRILFQSRRDPDSARVLARLLPGGSLSRDVLERLAQAETPEQAAEVLAPTTYRDLSEQLHRFMQTGQFSALERLFEARLIAEVRTMARTNIFSIAVLMLYAWLKYNEVLNLRLIARAVARHLPQDRVREELIYA
jgi:V/A-type H+-transporting ATPase subunit C